MADADARAWVELSLGRWLRRTTVKARIEKVTGLIFVGVSVRLATVGASRVS
jgi:threonine/homoserine/homoserine lactone efflux protein